MLQLVELLDSSRAPGQLLDEVETLQADSVQDDDGETLGLGMATMRPAAKGWRRRGSPQRDGDVATFEQKMAAAIFLSIGSSR